MGKKTKIKSPEKHRHDDLYRRLIIYTLAVMLLFTARFVYHPLYLKTSRAECHTGAIASDILDHGFRFSYSEYLPYTPEDNENGIFVEGLAAVPFFALLGRNILSLKLLGFLSGALTMLIGLWIIAMAARSSESGAEFSVGRASLIFVFLYAFGPPMFIYTSASALGGHNEGALAASLIVALYAWRRRVKSTLSNVLLWCSCGLAIFWAKDALIPLAFVALFTIAPALKFRRCDLRDTLIGAASFAAGLTPAIAISIARRGGDIADMLHKLSLSGAGSFNGAKAASAFEREFYIGFGQNPVLIAAAMIAFIYEAVWILSFLGKKKKRGSESVFSVRVLIFAYVTALGISRLFLFRGTTAGTYQYLLLFCFYMISTTVARAGTWLEDRPSKIASVGGAFLFLIVIFSLNWKAIEPHHGSIQNMKSDTGRATCYWGFGRAFYINSGNPNRAAEKCRSFGASRSLECISGIPAWKINEPKNLMQTEAYAYAFGRGYLISEPNEIEKGCAYFSDVRRRICAAGALANISIEDSMNWKISFLNRPAPTTLPCEIGPIPFESYETDSLRPLVVLPDKYVKLCNQNRIQPHCGLYQGACARSPFDCLALNGTARNDCMKIYKLMN